MALHGATRETMTAREREDFEQQKRLYEMQSAHSIEIKKLDLELAKQEAKWSSWLKIPIFIILLPVKILFGIAFIFSVFTKKELPPEFWKFIG